MLLLSQKKKHERLILFLLERVTKVHQRLKNSYTRLRHHLAHAKRARRSQSEEVDADNPTEFAPKIGLLERY